MSWSRRVPVRSHIWRRTQSRRSCCEGCEQLHARELDVLTRIAHGQTNREIAADLGLGEETVKTHVSNVLAKLGVSDRTQAAVHALRSGLVPVDAGGVMAGL